MERPAPESGAAPVDYLNPRLALALETVYGVPAEKSNWTISATCCLAHAPSDTRLSELPAARHQRRADAARDGGAARPRRRGEPDARPGRLAERTPTLDDVTDVAIRVVGGPNYVNGKAADGINVNDVALPAAFPFLPTPWTDANGCTPTRRRRQGRGARGPRRGLLGRERKRTPRRRTRFLLAAKLLTTAALFGVILADGPGDPATAREQVPTPSGLAAVSSPAMHTEATIPQLEARVAAEPDDAQVLSASAKPTSSVPARRPTLPSTPRPRPPYEKVLAADRMSYVASTGLGHPPPPRHEFSRALELARQAVALRPTRAPAWHPRRLAGGASRTLPSGLRRLRADGSLEPNLSLLRAHRLRARAPGQAPRRARCVMGAARQGSGSSEHLAWTLTQTGDSLETGRPGRPPPRTERRSHVSPATSRLRPGSRVGCGARPLRRRGHAVPPRRRGRPGSRARVRAGGTPRRRATEEALEAYAHAEELRGLRRVIGPGRRGADPPRARLRRRSRKGARTRARVPSAAAPTIHAEDAPRVDPLPQRPVRRGADALGARTAPRHARGADAVPPRMIERRLGNGGAARAFLWRALAVNPYFSLRHVPVAGGCAPLNDPLSRAPERAPAVSCDRPAMAAPDQALARLTRNAVHVPRGRARAEAGARPAAPREARDRCHRAGHPHRPRHPASAHARLPRGGARRRPHRRRLHDARIGDPQAARASGRS